MSSNGRWVLSSSRDGTISIWDAQKSDLLCELSRGNHSRAEFCMVTEYIVSVFRDSDGHNEILLWRYQGI